MGSARGASREKPQPERCSQRGRLQPARRAPTACRVPSDPMAALHLDGTSAQRPDQTVRAESDPQTGMDQRGRDGSQPRRSTAMPDPSVAPASDRRVSFGSWTCHDGTWIGSTLLKRRPQATLHQQGTKRFHLNRRLRAARSTRSNTSASAPSAVAPVARRGECSRGLASTGVVRSFRDRLHISTARYLIGRRSRPRSADKTPLYYRSPRRKDAERR